MTALVGYALALVVALLLAFVMLAGRRAVVEQRKHAIAVLADVQHFVETSEITGTTTAQALRDLLRLTSCRLER